MFKLNQENLKADFCRIDSGRVVGAEEFLRLVAGASKFLESKGLRIAIATENSYLFAAALFAGLSQNKSIVILPNNRPGTLDQFKSEYDDLVTEESFAEIKPVMTSLEFTISPDASLVFYTSGSTGQPKKVSKRFDNFYREILGLEKTFAEKVQDSAFLTTVTHQHIYGFLFKVLWPICTKRTWFTNAVIYPEEVEQLAKTVSSFTLVSTPAFLKRYFLPDTQTKNCQTVFSSGGMLDFEQAQTTFSTLGVHPIEVYGSTETGGVAFRERMFEKQTWHIFNDVQIRTLPDGQLVVNSPYFDEDSLLMGDRVEISDQGFTILGRVDDIVKIEEKRLSLSEMNQRLLSSHLIKEAVLISLDQGGRQQVGCLAVLSAAGQKLLDESNTRQVCAEIRNHLKAYFEPIVIPRKFRFIEKLPYNEQAKLIQSELVGYFDEHR
jgi:acyl-coenzyme A synthetase/AMP-(fatty) acid ligase